MSLLIILWTLMLGTADAQELSRPAERPDSPGDDDFLSAMTFRSQHLSVRALRTYSGGHTAVVYRSWGPWYTPYWGIGSTYVVREPVQVHESWAVYRGLQKLTVPGYLQIAGQAAEYERLTKQIRGNRTASTVLGGLALAGAASAVVGLVGANTAPTYREWRQWGIVSTAGITVAIGGGLGSALTAGRARQLTFDFPVGLDLATTHEQVDQYNDRLRRDLGLTAKEARRILELGIQQRDEGGRR